MNIRRDVHSTSQASYSHDWVAALDKLVDTYCLTANSVWATEESG